MIHVNIEMRIKVTRVKLRSVNFMLSTMHSVF